MCCYELVSKFQISFDGTTKRCKRFQNASGQSFPNERCKKSVRLEFGMVDIYLGSILQVSRKLSLHFVSIQKKSYLENRQILTSKTFCCQLHKLVYLTQFSLDFNNLGL